MNLIKSNIGKSFIFRCHILSNAICSSRAPSPTHCASSSLSQAVKSSLSNPPLFASQTSPTPSSPLSLWRFKHPAYASSTVFRSSFHRGFHCHFHSLRPHKRPIVNPTVMLADVNDGQVKVVLATCYRTRRINIIS